MAVGIAATWTDYTEVPLAVKMAMYWWAPDPTYLELNPMTVKFPEHNAQEFSAGLYTSDSSQAVISTLVSHDLVLLAPIVQTFADNVDLPMSEMDAMLLDEKTNGNENYTWEEVTCKWLKANRATWEKWIPDESECFPGFGLYDSVLQEFVEKREHTTNRTNKIVCQACVPGTFSQKLEDGLGTDGAHTQICVPCGKGTSQASGAALSCKPCQEGEYQDEAQSTECKRCDFGTYQDQIGQQSCKACPQSTGKVTTNTLGFGSVAETDCGCPEGFIDMDETAAFGCVQCGEGMTCPALSQLTDLKNGTSAVGEKFTPKIQRGHWAAAGCSFSMLQHVSVVSLKDFSATRLLLHGGKPNGHFPVHGPLVLSWWYSRFMQWWPGGCSLLSLQRW